MISCLSVLLVTCHVRQVAVKVGGAWSRLLMKCTRAKTRSLASEISYYETMTVIINLLQIRTRSYVELQAQAAC